MPSRSPDSFPQITNILSRSLKQAFDEVCPERYGGPLTLRQTESPADVPGASFRLEGPRAIDLQIHVQVSHVGGNVYDISTQVEDGPSRCFTLSEPDHSGSSLSIAPYLGKKIARHLLDEVEQRLGQEVLRRQVVADE
ncbi:MAG: hypothetical protein ABEL97_04015 [Salinibacter sp.]